jgi:prevent-host-death family protein
MRSSRFKLSATEAARNFSDLVNRVYYKGETFVVERGGEPVCKISPAAPVRFTGAEFVQLLSKLPRPDHEYFDVIEGLNKKQEPLGPSPWER